MLTLPQIQHEIARITYKPGWTFHLADHPREGALLRIQAQVPDSTSTQPVTLGINTWLPPIPTREYLHQWVRWRLTRIELHELAEFLKADDRVLDDPHADTCPWTQAHHIAPPQWTTPELRT
jgi:hypothetical protein